MKEVLRNLTDVLDGLAALAALGAVAFIFKSLGSIKTGPEFMQIALFATTLAVVPYCLAGAVHRIWARFP